MRDGGSTTLKTVCMVYTACTAYNAYIDFSAFTAYIVYTTFALLLLLKHCIYSFINSYILRALCCSGFIYAICENNGSR